MSSTEEQLLELLLKTARGELTVAESIGLHPFVLDKLADRANGLVRLGKLDEAERLLVDLARVDGLSPVLPFMLGACRVKQKDLTGAVDAYGEGLRRAEKVGFDAMIPRVRICRARALLDLGQIDAARDDLAAVAASRDAILAKEASLALASLAG